MTTADGALTVMTLNIWNTNHWVHRRDAIVEWVSEIQPDLLALQEVVRSTDGCQATWLADRLGMTSTFAAASGGSDRQFGNAVLSALPVVNTRSLRLTDGGLGGERRCIVTVEVETARGLVSFSSTHLAYRFDEGCLREAQVVEIADFLKAPEGGYPTILCGDLNATPDSTEVRFLKGLSSIGGRSFHLFDAFEQANPGLAGFTWNNQNPNAAANHTPNQRIDYILVGLRANDGAGQVATAGIVCDSPRNGKWPSDHFGVAAWLTGPSAASVETPDASKIEKAQPEATEESATQAKLRPEAGSDAANLTVDPEVERPNITLDDVAGLDDVKQHLSVKVFAPLRNPGLAQQFGRLPHGGLLLWGPPGCGKTFIARALAGSLDVSFVTAGLNEILGMYIGDTERGISALFDAARRAAPSVLFIDEFDALGGQRSQMGRDRVYRSLVSSLLVEMDGVGSNNDALFTIAATNMPWDVDSALRRPGRFDRTVFVPPPDEPARIAILATALAKVPWSDDVNVTHIAKMLKRHSGADTRMVAERAIDNAFARSVHASETMPVTQNDLAEAAKATGSSIEPWIVQAKIVGEASNDNEMFAPFFGWLRKR